MVIPGGRVFLMSEVPLYAARLRQGGCLGGRGEDVGDKGLEVEPRGRPGGQETRGQ